MKELDVIVTRYYEHRFEHAPADEQATFVRILESVEDPDLWAWVMGYAPTPAEFADVVDRLRQRP